jgi:hypothetical protein
MKVAVFWIVSRQFIEEAARSASSFHVADPIHSKAETWLFTPSFKVGQPDEFRWTNELPARKHKHWFLDSTRYFMRALRTLRAEGFDVAIYLDADTFVCGDLTPLVHLAKSVDFAGAHAPGRRTRATTIEIPSSFPEINIGVNLFNLRNYDVIETVDLWYERYLHNVDLYGNNDQASLRETLWHNRYGIRTAVLPPEFNFRFGFGGFLRGRCVVLHGRSNDIRQVARKVNAINDFRTFQRGEL